MMEESWVEAEAAFIPLKLGLEDLGLQGLKAQIREVKGLEQAFNQLIEELQRVAEAATPRKKANRGKGSLWWSQEVQEARREARRAEREYWAAPLELGKEKLNH